MSRPNLTAADFRRPKTYRTDYTMARVDGEAFTYKQIAARADIPLEKVRQRVGYMRKRGQVITWAALKGES